jgi:hypothetical protein
MLTESRERVFRVIGGEYYNIRVLDALLDERPYAEAFKQVPTSGAFNPESWDTIAKIHQLVVVWRPQTAHEWLEVASQPLLVKEPHYAGEAYIKGSFLGLLEAGVWLDKEWAGPTHYQEALLLLLAKVMCGPVKLLNKFNPANRDHEEYGKQLSKTLKEFMFPSNDRQPTRAAQIIASFQYLRQHGNDDVFSTFDNFVIERLCHGLLAARPATAKIMALHYLLNRERRRRTNKAE